LDKEIVIKGAGSSKQFVANDYWLDNYIEPFISFGSLLAMYYANTYHRRSIRIKAAILSQIEETNLDQFIEGGTTAKDLLYSFLINMEIHGNAFLEKTQNNKLYLLPTQEARVDTEGNFFQVSFGRVQRLEALHMRYYSPSSRWYGEPDYLATLLQIQTTQKADKYNDSFFNNGAKPDFAIVFENSEPTSEQMEAFKTFFGENYKGYDNAHKSIVLAAKSEMGEKDAKIRLEELSKIEDISFEKLKSVNRDEIISAHGVPPRLVGVMNSGQLGGGQELIGQLHAFNELEIKPKIELTEQFFKTNGYKLKLKPLDVTNFKDDADVITGLVDRNIISITEARDILGWQKNLGS